MNFGWVTDEATSFSIMDEALERGINLFDSADVYGSGIQPPSERARSPADRDLTEENRRHGHHADGRRH
jgi:aryl-alcohol dehydrogenase-like predicted oxidoreductase